MNIEIIKRNEISVCGYIVKKSEKTVKKIWLNFGIIVGGGIDE